MKGKYGALVTVPAMVGALFATASSASASAYTTNLTTSVTYQNVSTTSAANVTFTFYGASGSPIAITKTLAAGAGASLFLGSQDAIKAGFSGSAVVSSDQPIVATLVQLDVGSPVQVRNRPLSNGFGASDGSKSYLIATVLKEAFSGYTTKFSVQNVDAATPATVSVAFNAAGATSPTTTKTYTIQPGAAQYVDAGTISELGATFNGSATITSNVNVVASALELGTKSNDASSFEGVTGGATTVYMASALCNFSAQKATTAYAVQNVSAAPANVTVTYSDGVSKSSSVAAGSKVSFNSCTDGFSANVAGSATIKSDSGNIVAIGKVFNGGLYTAFVGATAGSAKLAAPYVRYSTSKYTVAGGLQRANIAIQNVGTATVTGATVKYYDLNGVLVGTHTLPDIAAGAKTNSSAIAATGDTATLAEFGYSGNNFGGSAIIEGPTGSSLTAVIRISSAGTGSNLVGEDYNAIPIQ